MREASRIMVRAADSNGLMGLSTLEVDSGGENWKGKVKKRASVPARNELLVRNRLVRKKLC
jgi:hypothetical protein